MRFFRLFLLLMLSSCFFRLSLSMFRNNCVSICTYQPRLTGRCTRCVSQYLLMHIYTCHSHQRCHLTGLLSGGNTCAASIRKHSLNLLYCYASFQLIFLSRLFSSHFSFVLKAPDVAFLFHFLSF